MNYLFQLFLPFVSMLTFSTPAIAGDALPPVENVIDLMSMKDSLGSVTGIVALTMFLVEVIKRTSGNVTWISRVPTWIISLWVSGMLTVAAHYGLGLLEGNFGELLWQVLFSAATASGIYSWMTNITKSPLDKKLNKG